MGDLTLLFAAVRAGEPGAVDRVVAATYRELHTLARQRLSRTPTITLLDTTALVHAHFMGYAARATRSIVVDITSSCHKPIVRCPFAGPLAVLSN